MSSSNPFAQLFDTDVPEKQSISSPQREPSVNARQINDEFEEIFLFTLNPAKTNLVQLEELKSMGKHQLLDSSSLDQALFERLLMSTPRSSTGIHENKPVIYLYHCYHRLMKYNKWTPPVTDGAMDAIFSELKLCFIQPDIFPDSGTCEQMWTLWQELCISSGTAELGDLLTRLCRDLSDEGVVSDSLSGLLRLVTRDMSGCKLADSTHVAAVTLVNHLCQQSHTAKVVVQFSMPTGEPKGKDFEQTLLGQLIRPSCLPTNTQENFQFFNKPSAVTTTEYNAVLQTMHVPTAALNTQVFQVFRSLLKLGSEVRDMTLTWIGQCLSSNKGRAQLWSQRDGLLDFLNPLFVSHGFALNLCAVLLRLTQPFTRDQDKLRLIKPLYCRATGESEGARRQYNVHIQGLNSLTCLQPALDSKPNTGHDPATLANDPATPSSAPTTPSSAPTTPSHEPYNFITESFFMTHYALTLGFTAINGTLLNINQQLARVQDVYNDMNSRGEAPPELKERMDKGLTAFLNLKAVLTEPQLLDLCLDLHLATASCLVEWATGASDPSFPVPLRAPACFSQLPEMLVENVADFIIFIRRFSDQLIELQGSRLDPFITFILVYMGSPQFIKNPHLRARLAEALEAFLPSKSTKSSPFTGQLCGQCLQHHPLMPRLAEPLVHVFVSIEMTGSGVAFEQKFNYRRPMYKILKYLWTQEVHRAQIQKLSQYALQHIEDTDAPLFLRFINLLINDAIYLLDEAINYLIQIRSKESERDSGAWASLNPRQRQEAEAGLNHMTMLARYHNNQGRETISVLEMITEEIHDVFIHSVMVDRLVAMLNYFLVKLAGPKRGDLKVKDFTKYDFRPGDLVASICGIYLHLQHYEEFCQAVVKDGRSYSHSLFVEAEQVLYKIHRPFEFCEEFKNLGLKFQSLSVVQGEDDELDSLAPDNFKDPLMNTIMNDPVMLPASRVIMDRTTIARQILSDQFDPYNREPLTLDMVIPQPELKEEIQQWKKEQRKSK